MAKVNDKDTGRRLVPYDSSSDEESPLPPPKRQCAADLDDGSDFVKKWYKFTEKYKHKVFLDSDSDGPGADDSDEDDDDDALDDDELLGTVIAAKRRNQREVYQIAVDSHPDPREKSLCLKLLKEIGCEDNFLCCSVDIPTVFYASLDRDEASRLEGIKGVIYAEPRRNCFSVIS